MSCMQCNFLLVHNEDTTESSIKVKELAVLKLGATLAQHKMEEGTLSVI